MAFDNARVSVKMSVWIMLFPDNYTEEVERMVGQLGDLQLWLYKHNVEVGDIEEVDELLNIVAMDIGKRERKSFDKRRAAIKEVVLGMEL